MYKKNVLCFFREKKCFVNRYPEALVNDLKVKKIKKSSFALKITFYNSLTSATFP